MVAPVILVEASPRQAADGAAVTVRLAGNGASVPYRYGDQHWRAGLTGLPKSVASLDFDGEQLGGGGVAQAMELSWAPSTKAALAEVAGLYWTDAPIVVRVGPEGADMPPIVTTGLGLETSVDRGVLKIALADQAVDLKRPVLVDRFLGTGGIEGPVEFTDVIKSRAWGRNFNVPGQQIDAANNIWCFGDPRRRWQAFDQVRDKGAAAAPDRLTVLDAQASAEATFAALQAAPALEGGGVLCPSIACVKWWTEPAGDLHADIRGEISGGYVETAPEIVARIVTARSVIPFSTGALAAAAAARPAAFGWRVDTDSATAAGEISQILGDVSTSWLLIDGKIVFRHWDWTAPARAARSYAVSRKSSVKPTARRKLGYRRNCSPMARGDLAAIVLVQDIVYEDGTPIADAIDNAGKTADWETVTGPAKPADHATNSADPNSAFGSGTVKEAVATLDKIVPIEQRFEPIESDISALELAKVTTDASLGALTRATADQSAALRQIDRDAGRLDEALLRLLSESSRTRAILRDAGIVVDPVTGVVRIYAVDQLVDRTSSAELAIDGVKSTITQKASVNYVNQQIALAVLNPAQAAQLEPIIARLTSAEQTIDGLNAVVALKAEAIELTRVSGTVATVRQDLNALTGTVSTKAEKTVVDALGIAVGSVEQTLLTLGNVSGISITIRQARAVADDAATATLRGLLAADDGDRQRIVAQGEIRQELYTKIVDGLTAEAVARTLLSVKVGDLDVRSVQETSLLIAQDKVLGQRIDALGIVADGQAAAIATLTQATIGAGVGIAGIQTTIRQQSREVDQSAEALLGSLIAGDQAGQRRAAQLVQIQTEFTTTLVANEVVSAVAREALLARMGLAEAAIVTTSKVLADTTQALTSRIAAAEAVFNDAGIGLAATRARLIQEETLRAAGDQANAEALAILGAQVNNPATGLPATAAEVKRVDRASADRDTAIGESVAQVSARIADPDTGLAAIAADIVQLAQARVSGDEANANLIQQVRARLDSVGGVTIEQKFEALVEATGRILGTVTVAIDTNGNMNGYKLIGSPDGPGSLNLINTDLRMGTGRVVFNNGTYMQVQGVAFGVARDLLEWFGPSMAMANCSRANAISYKAIDGDAYFGGSLSAGTLRNSAASSGVGLNETALIGPFGSNGKPVKYVASWSYRTSTTAVYAANTLGLQQYDQAAASFGAQTNEVGEGEGVRTTARPNSLVTLSRAFAGFDFVQLDQRNFATQTETFSGRRPTIGDASGRAVITTTIGGGFTVNDPMQSATDRTVRLVLARGFSATGDTVTQRLTIVATEE